MTCLVQVKLLEDAIAVAIKVNLDIGVTTDVIHSTQLQSLVAMVNAACAFSKPWACLPPVLSVLWVVVRLLPYHYMV